MKEYGPLINVIDLETTGLDPEKDRIVEFAVVTIEVIRCTLVNRVSCLTDPGIPIPPEASAIHHITDGMVRRQPQFGPSWAELVDEETIRCAHNARFDSAFVPDGGPPWICTFRVAKHLWPDAPGFGNQVLRYWLGLDIGHNGIPHRALFDATVTAHILGAAIRQVREEGVSDPVKHLLELTERPALLRTVPFGKHRGELWRDVPRDYIDWVLRKQFDDPDIVHTARAAARGEFAGDER